ncbi:MAG: DUF3124 domain-containing protein [Myxococcota bacterium]
MLKGVLCVLCAVWWTSCASPPEEAQSHRKPKKHNPSRPLVAGTSAIPDSDVHKRSSQLLYVPVYSSLLHFDQRVIAQYSANVSIRNTDLTRSLTIRFADYYDNDGELIYTFLTEPKTLGPLGSLVFFIPEGDRKGGPGANLLVEWTSDTPISVPLVESVMMSNTGARGFAFTSPAKVLREARNVTDSASKSAP